MGLRYTGRLSKTKQQQRVWHFWFKIPRLRIASVWESENFKVYMIHFWSLFTNRNRPKETKTYLLTPVQQECSRY